MLHFRLATIRDVRNVLKDKAGFTQSELNNLFVSDSDVLSYARAVLPVSYSLACYMDKKPAFVFMCAPKQTEPSRNCSFIASSLFDLKPRAAALAAARGMARVDQALRGDVLRCVTGSRHPATGKWFEMLGFVQTGTGECVKVFEKAL